MEKGKIGGESGGKAKAGEVDFIKEKPIPFADERAENMLRPVAYFLLDQVEARPGDSNPDDGSIKVKPLYKKSF